jgi:hypothetical protein
VVTETALRNELSAITEALDRLHQAFYETERDSPQRFRVEKDVQHALIRRVELVKRLCENAGQPSGLDRVSTLGSRQTNSEPNWALSAFYWGPLPTAPGQGQPGTACNFPPRTGGVANEGP